MPPMLVVYPLPGVRWAIRRARYRMFGYPPGLERASLLNYVMWRCWKATAKDGITDLRYYRFFVYLSYRKLKEKGIDCKLPHYWHVDGPEIEWNSVNDIIQKVGYGVRLVLK